MHTYQDYINKNCTLLQYLKDNYAGNSGSVKKFLLSKLRHPEKWPFYVVSRQLEDYYGKKYIEFRIFDGNINSRGPIFKYKETQNLNLTLTEFWDFVLSHHFLSDYISYLRDTGK